MIYAVIDKNGRVENRIELEPRNLVAYAAAVGKTLIPDTKNVSQIGGTWDGSTFRPKTQDD